MTSSPTFLGDFFQRMGDQFHAAASACHARDTMAEEHVKLAEKLAEAEREVRSLEAEMERRDGIHLSIRGSLEQDRDTLRLLVRSAYNEGFNEGMREVNSQRGGKAWLESKACAALSRYAKD